MHSPIKTEVEELELGTGDLILCLVLMLYLLDSEGGGEEEAIPLGQQLVIHFTSRYVIINLFILISVYCNEISDLCNYYFDSILLQGCAFYEVQTHS